MMYEETSGSPQLGGQVAGENQVIRRLRERRCFHLVSSFGQTNPNVFSDEDQTFLQYDGIPFALLLPSVLGDPKKKGRAWLTQTATSRPGSHLVEPSGWLAPGAFGALSRTPSGFPMSRVPGGRKVVFKGKDGKPPGTRVNGIGHRFKPPPGVPLYHCSRVYLPLVFGDFCEVKEVSSLVQWYILCSEHMDERRNFSGLVEFSKPRV